MTFKRQIFRQKENPTGTGIAAQPFVEGRPNVTLLKRLVDMDEQIRSGVIPTIDHSLKTMLAESVASEDKSVALRAVGVIFSLLRCKALGSINEIEEELHSAYNKLDAAGKTRMELALQNSVRKENEIRGILDITYRTRRGEDITGDISYVTGCISVATDVDVYSAAMLAIMEMFRVKRWKELRRDDTSKENRAMLDGIYAVTATPEFLAQAKEFEDVWCKKLADGEINVFEFAEHWPRSEVVRRMSKFDKHSPLVIAMLKADANTGHPQALGILTDLIMLAFDRITFAEKNPPHAPA